MNELPESLQKAVDDQGEEGRDQTAYGHERDDETSSRVLVGRAGGEH